MARKPSLDDDTLYEVAMYLSRPEVETEIHAELPERYREQFEAEYLEATGESVPISSERNPYYVWPPGTNKQGRELRIYFKRVSPEPPPIRNLYTDQGKWYAKRESWRINHSNLVMQLFECGFLLGKNSENGERIREYMEIRFPVNP